MFTLFCVAGVADAFNLADGLNGLLGGLICADSSCLALVAWRGGDQHVLFPAMAPCGGTTGFLFLNFPFTRTFACDGGAYFVGTAIAMLGILVVARNPSISPWVSFAMVHYPFADTTCAILRRLVRRRPISELDAEHLHTLLARRLCARFPRAGRNLAAFLIVSVTAPFMLVASAYATQTRVLVVLSTIYFTLYTVTYVLLHRRIVGAGPGTRLSTGRVGD